MPFGLRKNAPRDFRLDVVDFNKYLDQLADAAKKHGFSTKEVILGEAAAVLASASELTNKADTKKIDTRYTLRRKPKKGANAGKNPNTSPDLIPFVKLNGKFYSTQNTYPPAIFSQMQKKLNFFKKRAKSRVYSAKAVWLVLARKARVFTGRFKSGARLNKAIGAQAGRYAKVNSGRRSGLPTKFTITLKSDNTVLLNKNARGSFAIRSAMARRGRFFDQNMKHGAFKTAQRVARAYPGIVMKGFKGAPTA